MCACPCAWGVPHPPPPPPPPPPPHILPPDWHHEGHKSCNYTFAALGGVWDCLFGTRKVGRRAASHGAETAHDRRGASANPISSARFDQPLLCVAPLAAVVAAGVATLSANGMRCAW